MRLYLALALMLLFAACDNLKWEGYSRTDSGIYYKRHILGDGERMARPGDRIYAEIKVFNAKGEQLFSNGMSVGSLLNVKLGSETGGLSEALSVLHSGDSASFVFPGDPGIQEITAGRVKVWSDELNLAIKLNRIESEVADMETPDLEMNELSLLGDYLAENNINPKWHVQGVYMKPLNKSEGPKPQSGQEVTIHYKGYLLDGQVFDDTRVYDQPLTFQMGKPDQVIRAFEIALHHIRLGQKIRVISPSQYAFGSAGSTSGIVPPFASVVYELELVNIR